MKRLMWFVAAFVAAVLVEVASSGCGPNLAPSGPSADVLGCNTGQVPSGYLRVDSEDAGLAGCSDPQGSFNVYVYAPYTGHNVGDTLLVCSGDSLTAANTAGWQLWNGPYRDVAGCDSKTSRVTQDPNYLNVMLIKKVQ